MIEMREVLDSDGGNQFIRHSLQVREVTTPPSAWTKVRTIDAWGAHYEDIADGLLSIKDWEDWGMTQARWDREIMPHVEKVLAKRAAAKGAEHE